MTKKNLSTRRVRNAAPTFETVLSKLESGTGCRGGYHSKVILKYVLGLGTKMTRDDDLNTALKGSGFYRSVLSDILEHDGTFLDIFCSYRNCTFFRDAAYFVKPQLFEDGWDNVSCIYGSIKISREEAHFFKNLLNVLGIKSTFKFDPGSGHYFVKIYCSSIALLNINLFTIRRFISKIANIRGVLPLIRDPGFRFRFLRNPMAYIIIINDKLWMKGHIVKKWSFRVVNGYEVLHTPIGDVRLDDWRVCITI